MKSQLGLNRKNMTLVKVEIKENDMSSFEAFSPQLVSTEDTILTSCIVCNSTTVIY